MATTKTATLPGAVVEAIEAAAAAGQAVTDARQAVERGRLDRPTLMLEMSIVADEINRLDGLAQPRRNYSPSAALMSKLRRRRAELAELQVIADEDRQRCDAMRSSGRPRRRALLTMGCLR